jgi:hypothetical protein
MQTMLRRVLPAVLAATTVACAPFGGGIMGGGSTSSFSSVGSPVPEPAGGADTQAQELLLRALGDAISASGMAGGTFAAIDPSALGSTDPQLRAVGDLSARVGVVTINLASDDGLVLSTKSKSGRSFCVSMTSASGFAPPDGGTVDAHGATNVKDYTGTNWMFGP